MKKNLLWSVILLMAGAVITSCSNDKTDGPDKVPNEKTSINIYFSKGSVNPEGRAVSPPVGAGNVTVTFNSGMMIFADAAGSITKKITINSGTGTAPFDNAVGIDDLTAQNGAKIENVPSSSQTVHIYGNMPAAVNSAMAAATNMTALNAIQVGIATQMDMSGTTPTYGKDNVMIYGSAGIDYSQTPAKAEPKVAPIVSRIEIAQFGLKASTVAEPNTMVSFRVDGLFISDAYENASPNGIGIGTIREFGPSNPNKTTYLPVGVSYNGNPGTYPNEFEHVWYDYSATGIGAFDLGTGSYAPANDQVWAYHAFASTETPNVVARVTQVVKENAHDYGDKPRFLTVVKFFDSSGTEITSFPAGKIFKIASIDFRDAGTEGTGQPPKNEDEDDGNFTDKGNDKIVEIIVEVEIVDWEIENITAGLIGD